MSKYEIRVTAGELVAGYASLVDAGDAMQRVAEALRPKAEVLPRWTYPDGYPKPDDAK